MLERVRELAIPPAWEDVWVCPYPMGHIQATGIDAAGRKQYRYHDRWRERRDGEKFESMEEFARALPRLRKRVSKDLAREGMPRERVLACAVRLLDLGFFRIGSEDYAEENDTYGIATMGKRHVTVEGDVVSFDYEAKGGQRRRAVLRRPRRGRGGPRAQAPPRRRRGAARLEGGPPLDGREVARRERLRQGGHRRGLHRQGLPHLERHGPRRRRAVGLGGSPRAARRPPASARRRARSRRWPATSATRPRSAAPPTSTRACSTASTAGSRSAGCCRSWRRTRARGPTSQGRSRRAVLDLLAGDRDSDAVTRARDLAA